jgi:GNAT superfamily N-acetyltransferase
MSPRFRTPVLSGPWDNGPLLPHGWRPDREDPAEDVDSPRWVVVDPAGHLRLGDGTDIALRPFLAGDGNLLLASFDRLSAQSRYRRFLSPVPQLTGSMLAFLTSVDGVNHRAWGAVVDEPAGPVGAGVARWVRTNTDPGVADVAVTVIDDYQGRGLGGLLLNVAVLDAFAHGVDRFEGIVLGENISSRRMLARGGATLRPEGGGVLAFTLPLRARVDLLRESPLPALIAAQRRHRADLPA